MIFARWGYFQRAYRWKGQLEAILIGSLRKIVRLDAFPHGTRVGKASPELFAGATNHRSD